MSVSSAFVVVPGVIARGTRVAVCAKGKKKGGKKNARSKKIQPLKDDVSNFRDFVSAPLDGVEDDEIVDEVEGKVVDSAQYESRLPPISGSKGDKSKPKKRPVGKEPQAIKIAKQAAWVGIGLLVAIELYVHLIAVGDWNPFKNSGG